MSQATAKKASPSVYKPGIFTFLVALPSFVAIAAFQVFRLWEAMPTVLQDEYVYSTGTKYGGAEEAARFGNFLYFEIYRNTQLCGPEFYSCARYLNAFWFVVFMGVLYAFAIRYLSKKLSLALVAGIGLGPIALYASLYMPEMMYFAFAGLGLLLYVIFLEQTETRRAYLILIASMAVLALGAMVKPHAAFVAIGVIAHLVLRIALNFRKRIAADSKHIGIALAAFLVTKLGVGFLLAGTAGLTIFGRSYTGALTDFLGDLFGISSPDIAGTSDASAEPAESSESLLSVLDVFFIHFILVLVSILILMGPTLAIMGLRKDFLKLDSAVAIIIQLFVMGTIVSFFTAHITANGDDHSDRLLFRYFEFLVPFLLIIGIHYASITAFRGWKRYVAVLAPVLGVILVFTGIDNRRWIIADGAHLFSLFEPVDSVWIWTVVVAFSTYILINEVSWRKTGVVLAFSIGLIGIGQLGINEQLNTNGFKIASDYAGLHVYENFQDIPGEEILVLGSDRKLVEASMFAIDKPGIDFELYQDGSLIPEDLIDDKYTLVVQTLGVYLLEPPEDTFYGEGFAVSIIK